MATSIKERIAGYEQQIERMEANNDGSIEWVDAIQDIYTKIWELQISEDYRKECL